MPQLGDVFINTVYAENPRNSVRATSHPVEDGVNVTDHIEKEPLRLDIEGIINGPDAAIRMQRIKQYMESGERLKYVYRNAINNVIVESFYTTHDTDVAGGLKFTMSLKQVFIAKPSIVVKLPKELRPQVAKIANKGRQQTSGSSEPKKVYTVKSGDTLTKIGDKFNVSWRKIYNKNKSVIGPNEDLIYIGQKLIIP